MNGPVGLTAKIFDCSITCFIVDRLGNKNPRLVECSKDQQRGEFLFVCYCSGAVKDFEN